MAYFTSVTLLQPWSAPNPPCFLVLTIAITVSTSMRVLI